MMKHIAWFLLTLIFVAILGRNGYAQMFGNPFCPIRTIAIPNHPLGGQATFDPRSGEPIILVDPNIQTLSEETLRKVGRGSGGGPAFMRFLLAHECAHHLNGHLGQLSQVKRFQAYALLLINASFELDADCTAAQQLRRNGDHAAVNAAADFFALTQGPFSAQAGYPSGHQRAQTILKCGQ